MANPVLDRLRADRQTQIEFVDATLAGAERDSRDLVDAEVANIRNSRERIGQLDAQIEPLVAFEDLRDSAVDTANRALGRAGRRDLPPATNPGESATYRSAGAYLVDYVRSRDPRADQQTRQHASERLDTMRAVANVTTVQMTGVLPELVVGPIVNLIDATRPLVTSVGARPMDNIPGTKFQRPRVTQHVSVAKQAAEKTQLSSTPMIITPLEFLKETYGGTVDVSRQSIDWSSPAAWDAITQDLADMYAKETEAAAAAALAAAVVQTEQALTGDLEGYANALYAAAAKAYTGASILPNAIWMSLDMWAKIGPITDVLGRLSFVPVASGGAGAGSFNVTNFSGDMLGVQRIVVPTLPAATTIVGHTSLFEFYEQQIGLLSAVEPSLLGVEVAYGGYIACGAIEPLGFCKILAAPIVP